MAVPPLLPDELVDDRALRKLEDDAFRHGDFVDELEGVVRHTPTPTTISVYAPWGSGKTSLAYLLAARFKNDEQVRFVRFDAMKYAETPLRRHFLSKVAEELGVEDSEFREGLYETRTQGQLIFTKESVKQFACYFLVALAALAALALLAATVYAVFAKGPAGEQFRDAISWLGPKLFVPAGAFGALGALVSRKTHEHKTEAPSSPEEFETRFRNLVKKEIGQRSIGSAGKTTVDDKKRRLCVFVDELDRCSAEQVVSTLDSIRTFFEVTGCVFIVAADQQALEEALSKAVEQETPANVTEPYYSAGTAHLDKVFHPQLPLPPIKQQTLSRFAVQLVEDKPGVWEKLAQAGLLEDALSVLIPTHVHSPRRVKALLNSFLLLYRTAWRRADEGMLAANVEERAVEIAKLACLRLEFPRFAQDLALDARMPELVLEEVALGDRAKGDEDDDEEQSELPPRITVLRPGVRERARRWACKELAVDDLLVDGKDTSEQAKSGTNGAVTPRSAAIQQEHARQLLRYLQKTRRVPGPSTDLVHLESAAAGLNLPHLAPSDADAIERAALDADVDGVVDLVSALDADQQCDAFTLLVYVVRNSSVGIEGENTVAVLLRALGTAKDSLGEVANAAAVAVGPHTYKLAPDDLAGALALSLQSSRAEGRELRRKVRDHEAGLSSLDLCQAIVAQAQSLLAEEADWVGDALLTLLRRDPREAAAEIRNLEADAALSALDAVEEPLREHLSELSEVTQEARTEMVAPLTDALDLLAQDSPLLAQRYAAVLLAASDGLEDEVNHRFSDLGPIADPSLVSALVALATRRTPEQWTSWLSAVPLEVMKAAGVPELLTLVALNGWQDYRVRASDEETLRAGLQVLKPFADAGLMAADERFKGETDKLGSAVANSAEAEERTRDLHLAADLVEMGLIESGAVADAAIASVRASLDSRASTDVCGDLLALASEFAASASDDELERLQAAAPTATRPTVEATIGLIAARALNKQHNRDESSPVSGTGIRELVETYGDEFLEGLTIWLRDFATEPAEVWESVSSFATPDRPDPELADALRYHCNWWHREGRRAEHDDFLKFVVRAAASRDIHSDFLRACLLAQGNHTVIAQELGTLEADADTPDAADRLLKVWETLSPTDEQVLRLLAKQVLLPLARRGAGYLDLMLTYSPLAAKLPKDRRAEFRKLIRATAKTTGREEEVETRFRAVGLVKRKGRIRKKDEDV